MVDSTANLIFHRSFLIFNLSSIKVFLCKTSSQSCFNFITDSPYSHYYSYHRYDKDYRHILCTGQSQHAAVYPVWLWSNALILFRTLNSIIIFIILHLSRNILNEWKCSLYYWLIWLIRSLFNPFAVNHYWIIRLLRLSNPIFLLIFDIFTITGLDTRNQLDGWRRYFREFHLLWWLTYAENVKNGRKFETWCYFCYIY